jgi:CheY-like chemotaxis protein
MSLDESVPRLRVLVVDDDIVDRMTIARLLVRSFELTLCASAEDALNSLAAESVSLRPHRLPAARLRRAEPARGAAKRPERAGRDHPHGVGRRIRRGQRDEARRARLPDEGQSRA